MYTRFLFAFVASLYLQVSQAQITNSGYKLHTEPEKCYAYAIVPSEDGNTIYISSVFCYSTDGIIGRSKVEDWAKYEFNSRIDAPKSKYGFKCQDGAGWTGSDAPQNLDFVRKAHNETIAFYRDSGKKVSVVQFPQCK